MKKHTFSFDATGTRWTVTLWCNVETEHIERDVKDFVEDFEQTYSRFRENSFLSQLAGKTGTHTVPEDFTAMLRLYARFYAATDGAMTPLMGEALSAAGYDRDYSFSQKEPVTVPAFSDAVTIAGDTQITIHEPVSFDLGAVGKGYLVDLLAQKLRRGEHTERFAIDAGGDVLHNTYGGELLSVGLEHPEDRAQLIGTVRLANKALCASGANKRRWSDTAHHIIDPHKGMSVSRVYAVWALADSVAVADGVATSLFFAAPEKLQKQFDFEWIVMENAQSARYSRFFQGALFAD